MDNLGNDYNADKSWPTAIVVTSSECYGSAGTGGFFFAAYDHIANPDNYSLDKNQKAFLKHETFFGF